jgi:hypothetical protein
MQKKLRQRLEIGRPIFLINSATSKHDISKSLELQDFQCSVDRLSWTVRCGNGQLISGGIRDSRQIPFLPGAQICLALPVKLHLRKRNTVAPDFIIEMPSSYLAVSELASIR